ncbi:MAG: CBS domain-containing protein [Gemmatimonadota bacterium]
MSAAAGQTNSDRFLAAFARLEDAFEALTGGRRHRESFANMVHQAGRKNASIRMFENDLREFAELRNAIVHDRGHGYVIAEPHDKVVAKIERITDIVLDPPRVSRLLDAAVVTLRPDQTLGDVAGAIRQTGYAQYPVYDEHDLVGLLTYRALARWLAARFDAGEPVDPSVPISEVLAFANSAHAVVAQDAPVLDVVELFAENARQGRHLTAVLITRSGADGEPPLGIVTAADLPRLYGLVERNGT